MPLKASHRVLSRVSGERIRSLGLILQGAQDTLCGQSESVEEHIVTDHRLGEPQGLREQADHF